MCREFVEKAEPDILLRFALENLPRRMICGEFVTGCQMINEHAATCLECMRAQLSSARQELNESRRQYNDLKKLLDRSVRRIRYLRRLRRHHNPPSIIDISSDDSGSNDEPPRVRRRLFE